MKKTNAEECDPLICLMVIDDDKDIGEAMKLAISLTNNTCSYFSNPKDAIEAFEKEPEKYQGVFTDLRMPEMSGEQVISKIRKINKTVPIIICTANGGIFTTDDLVKLNIPSIIAKPFELSDIELAIKLIQERLTAT